MNNQALNKRLFLKHLNISTSVWFAIGLMLGILGWANGNSQVAAYGLKFASGFGTILLLKVAVQTVLLLLGRFSRPTIARLAVGDFHNLQRWVLGGLTRASGVFIGLSAVACLCWSLTGSANALNSALIASIITAVLLWFWFSLITFERCLPKQASPESSRVV